jgi:hypothetical protein
MDSRRNRVPAPTMTLAEAADVLGIDAGLARQLAEDAQFPVTGGGATNRLPVSQVAMPSRVLHQGRATGRIRRGSRWRGPS